jgi:hypothetical protein
MSKTGHSSNTREINQPPTEVIDVTRRSLLEGKTIKQVDIVVLRDATRKHKSIQRIEFTDGSALRLSVDELDYDYAITGKLYK